MQPRDLDAQPRLLVGDIVIDPATRTAAKGETPIALTTVEFELLYMLLSSAGRVVTREEISRWVLGRESDPFDRSIDIHIGKVRRKLGDPSTSSGPFRAQSRDDPADGDGRIKTIQGVDYIYAQPRG